MKNLLMTILNILITLLVILLMVKGFTLGNFEVLSISKILKENEELDKQIENANYLKNTTYKTEIDSLNKSIKSLSEKKQEYLNIASISTDEEIENANTQQTYAREYLWNKVGSYATSLGVNSNITTAQSGSNNTLNFTVNGSYVGIIKYISALENDDDLQFKIENFKLSGTGDILIAVFSVPNITIKDENVTSVVENQNTDNTENIDNTENTANNENANDTTN